MIHSSRERVPNHRSIYACTPCCYIGTMLLSKSTFLWPRSTPGSCSRRVSTAHFWLSFSPEADTASLAEGLSTRGIPRWCRALLSALPYLGLSYGPWQKNIHRRLAANLSKYLHRINRCWNRKVGGELASGQTQDRKDAHISFEQGLLSKYPEFLKSDANFAEVEWSLYVKQHRNSKKIDLKYWNHFSQYIYH